MEQAARAASPPAFDVMSAPQPHAHRSARWLLALATAFACISVHAQDGSGGVEPFEEFGKHLRAAQEVTPPSNCRVDSALRDRSISAITASKFASSSS